MGMQSPTFQEQDELLRKAKELMAKKDEIESQLRELDEGLRLQGVGMDQPLVDASGFPRSDIDVAAARTSRNLVHRLRNDHKDIMKQIEQALHALHSSSKRQQETSSSATTSSSSSSSRREEEDKHHHHQQLENPFAVVNAVAPDSPAYTSGLRRGDKVLRFGTVHAGNHDRLQALNQLVARSQGVPINVLVLREERQRVNVTLTPRTGWGGKGSLGCHLLPL